MWGFEAMYNISYHFGLMIVQDRTGPDTKDIWLTKRLLLLSLSNIFLKLVSYLGVVSAKSTFFEKSLKNGFNF